MHTSYWRAGRKVAIYRLKKGFDAELIYSPFSLVPIAAAIRDDYNSIHRRKSNLHSRTRWNTAGIAIVKSCKDRIKINNASVHI